MSDISDWYWDSAPMEMLEIGYEDYLNQLFHDLESGNVPTNTLSGVEFCGCDTCCTRETLSYLMPRILDLYAQEHIRKISDE